MRRFRAGWFAPVIGLVLLGGIPADSRAVPGQGLAELMRRKLGASQKVLEGIALEKFDTVGKGARELKEISENAAWNVFPDSDYAQYSREFRAICDDLNRQAKDKDLDAATLSYVRLTMNCVQCHKFVRLKRP